MSAQKNFIEVFDREHEVTLKVLRAFPADQSEFKPHERSQTARTLAWTFALEQMLIVKALNNQIEFGKGFPPAPDDFSAIVEQFERDYHSTRELILQQTEETWHSMTPWFLGPGKMGEITKIQFAWFMVHDQIHHRGQMTVYLRMVGGKVPSIYGPSADEKWF